MARLNLKVKIDKTEALKVLLGMSEDLRDLIDIVPDHYPEKKELAESLTRKWKEIGRLVEL